MPKIRFTLVPATVFRGQLFTVHVVVENSVDGETIDLRLSRFDVAEGSWTASALIGSEGWGAAQFTSVSLASLGTANLKCASTSHIAIPAGTSLQVRAPGHVELLSAEAPADIET